MWIKGWAMMVERTIVFRFFASLLLEYWYRTSSLCIILTEDLMPLRYEVSMSRCGPRVHRPHSPM